MKNTLQKAEPYFFLLVCLLNAIPLFLHRFFPTMDGPAHLYNSTLIGDVLFGDNSLQDYYIFRGRPVPNWIGHFLLSIFDIVLPAWLAEKALLLSYFIFLPLSFRKLVSQFGNVWASYLIFPFTYSLLFFMGFYNLSLSLIFLFVTIAYWVRHQDNLNTKKGLILFGLITAAFFSHVFIYAILLFTLFLFSLQSFLKQETREIGALVKKNLYLLAASALSLIFFFMFLGTSQLPSTDRQLPFYELVKWIEDVRPLIALDYDKERSFTRLIFYVAMTLSGMIIYQRFTKLDFKNGFTIQKITRSGFFLASDVFALIALLLLTLYIKVPDGAGAGMMSDRFCLLFYFFFITWIASQPLPKRILIPTTFIILFLSYKLIDFYKDPVKDMNTVAVELEKAGEHIEPYSTVLPINRSGHWLMPHVSNYAGINTPIVLLENYEASLDWFPIGWNNEKMPRYMFGDLAGSPCYWWKTDSEGKKELIDYVLIFGGQPFDENCQTEYDRIITTYYEPVYSSDSYKLELFKLKSNL